jgi:hypothetical protein
VNAPFGAHQITQICRLPGRRLVPSAWFVVEYACFVIRARCPRSGSVSGHQALYSIRYAGTGRARWL